MRTRKYSGNSPTTKSSGGGISKLVELSVRRWSAECLGIYANRDKRGKPGDLSVHALWRAADIRFRNEADRVQACVWFVQHNHDLMVDLIVDYAYNKRDKFGRKAYGRSWRCDTQKWVNLKKGDVAGGGSAWADWLHIELAWTGPKGCPSTENGVLFEKIWRSLPKP